MCEKVEAEDCIEMAKLAEQAERYDDMSKVCFSGLLSFCCNKLIIVWLFTYQTVYAQGD